MTPRKVRAARTFAYRGAALALAAVLLVLACTNREVIGVVVGSVSVSPGSANLLEGETQQFTAVVQDDRGEPLSGADVRWTTADPTILAVTDDGVVEALLRGATEVRAEFHGVTGRASVIVIQSAGITVAPASGPTSEAGGTATFTVVLESPPTAAVTIDLSSTDATEGAVTAPGSQLTFTPANWSAVQTVTVTGQNDAVADGNIAYTIVTAPAVSVDARYSGIDAADVSFTNNDNDAAGISVSAVSGPTTEAGGLATFIVALTSEPAAAVTVGLSSSDASEGMLSIGALTFTTTNWNVAQTVTVTGQNDALADGNVVYTVVTAPATSSDPRYNGVNAADVTITNVDDETAGITVSPASGPTTEAGRQATFTVVLNTAPIADVTIDITSSDVSEGSISTGSLVFTPANWSVPQTVTVTGQNDALADGDIVYTILTAPAASADLNYSALNAADVSMTNVDDETATITTSPPSGPTTEAGGQATFTIVLSSQPTANVTVGISSSDTSEGTVSAVSLTFTTVNWNVPQTVAVTGQNDALADGNIPYTIVTAPASSADPKYNALNAADVSITNVDDETAGITVSAASGPTTEVGGQATFTVVLSTQPTASVSIGLTSSDVSEGVVSPASLTFTTANWNVPQSATVTGVNDDVDDDNIVFAIVTAPATSPDANYSALDPADVSVANVDDETAGVTVSPSGLVTTEVGGQASFTVVLNSQPNAAVAIGIASSDTSEGTTSTSTLGFTTANWNVPQTVTVTGQNDALADGNIGYVIATATATSTDPKYSAFDAADVSVTNIDDETAGITVSAASGATTEVGGQATFTVVLNTQPTSNVTIGISSSDASEGTVSSSSLTFTVGNWNIPQTVTVTGANDDVDDDNVVYTIVTGATASADPNYAGVNPADVLVTNFDDETAGITVSPATGPTTEAGGQATFTAVLNSQPTANVTIALTSNDTSEGTIAPPSLTFTASTWSTPQVATVTGQNDALADGNVVYTIVTAPGSSTDIKYNGLNAADVSVTNVDDETVGIAVSPASAPTTEAGGQATFTVVLNTQPTASVSIALSSSDATEGSVSHASLTFTGSTWNVAQTVTLTGVNDDVDDDNVVYTIVTAPATSLDASYNGLDAANVSVTNVDDETAGVTVSAGSGTTTEAGGTATFTVRLNSEPLANVSIGLSSSDATEGAVGSSSLTFTGANWGTPQTVTVTGQNDALADGNVVYIVVTAPATSTDAKYAGVNAADVSLTNVDDETAGITVSPASGPTTETGGQATFTLVLNNEPTASVTIGLSSSDATEGSISPLGLTFTPVTWNVPQTVTATGQNDDIDDDNVVYTIVTAPATSADPNYSGLNASDVLVTNVDDETAGITVSPASGPTTEAGGQAMFTVRLNTQPTASVTIGVASNDATEGLVTLPAGGTLSFTTANWSTLQTVTVTGQNDALADGNIGYLIVTAPATSPDTKYSGLNASDVSVTNVDNETVGITVSPVSGPTTEAGGTATFTVVLNSQPTASVIIGVSSNDATEGVVTLPAGGSLTFTTANWNTPQTVTVTGQDDSLADGNIAYTVVTAAAASSDASYNGINAADALVTNNDNDAVGITVSAPSGPTTEAGGIATFTVRLNSQPGASVIIGVSSNDATEGVVTTPAGGTLTFITGNWSTPQTVTVTGQNDAIADGNVSYSIVTAAATSTDLAYNNLNASDVSMTNIDDESAGITVTPVSGPTTEAGGTATFTVFLNSQPTASVTIGVSSSDATEGAVTSPASGTLTFTTGNWNNPQTVTVTGQNDDVDDDNVAYLIVTAPAASTDGAYNLRNAADVSVTNVDDETAGVTVSAPSGPTTEAGGTATFTVVLNSQPTASVRLGVFSNDSTEGVVTSPASDTLTFTTSNWNTPQPVTVTGQNDNVDDGNIVYTIVTAPATSSDVKYSGLNAADVSITNVDDDQGALSVNDAIVNEGNSGSVNAVFTVTLSVASLQTITVNYATANSSATAPDDYVATSGQLTFAPGGPLAQTVTVTVNGDVVDEGPWEAFTLGLSAAVNATISDASGVGTITDDEDATLSINDVVVTEGNAGPASAVFTVTQSVASIQTVTVNYVTANGSAVSGPDYVGTLGQLTFIPGGALTQTITVTVNGDVVDEGASETFSVGLSAAVNATISDATGIATITDDDDALLSINDVTVTEGNSGTVNAVFTVTKSLENSQAVTVNYATGGGTATAATDYTGISGTLTFPAFGALTQTLTVVVNGDVTFEPNETFNVNLTTPTNATIADALGVGTITNDDPQPTISINDVGVAEGNSGTTTAAFTVSLSNPSSQTITVDYATGIGTATAGTDYTAIVTTTLTFNPGVTTQPVNVTVSGDFVDEDAETFTVGLSSAANATISDNLGSGTIIDNDNAGFTMNPSGGLVTTEAGGQASFTVVLTSEPTSNVTINLSSSDATEGAITDPLTLSLTFTDEIWNIPQTVTVTGLPDVVSDPSTPYTIVTAPATSSDPKYNGVNPADVSVSNIE